MSDILEVARLDIDPQTGAVRSAIVVVRHQEVEATMLVRPREVFPRDRDALRSALESAVRQLADALSGGQLGQLPNAETALAEGGTGLQPGTEVMQEIE